MPQHKVLGPMKDTFIADLFLSISEGNIEGYEGRHIPFFQATIGTTEETVSDVSGSLPYLTEASIITVVSTSDEDTNLTGTGAWVASIHGLDADYNEIEDEIVLDGTSPVLSELAFLRLFTIHVHAPVGSTGGAVGNITAGVGVVTHLKSLNGNNTSLSSNFTIPAGKTGYLVYGEAGSGKGKDVTGKFYTRPENGAFLLASIFLTYQSDHHRPFPLPLRVPEKTDIEVKAKSDTASSAVSGSYDIILVGNP